MQRKISQKTLISMVVSLSLILFLLFRVGLWNLKASVSRVDGALFVIACLITVPNFTTKAFRWSRILRAQNINLSLSTTFQYYLMGWYAAVLTPGRIGDLFRSYLVSKRGKKSFGFITASVVFDRMLDLGTMLAITTLGVLYFFTPKQWETLSSTVILLVVFGIIGAFLVYIVFSTDFGKRFLLKIGTALIGRLPKTFAKNIDINHELNDFFEAIYLYRANITNLALSAVCSVAAWASYGFQGYVLLLAFEGDLKVSFWLILYFMTFIAFAVLIPFTISGFGAREALFIAFFGSIGIAEADALSFAFLFYTIAAWVPAIFGGLLLSKKRIFRRDTTENC